jgi:peptidoglycan/xylan/chitin deacetylase (PgdA/CDA1 family)
MIERGRLSAWTSRVLEPYVPTALWRGGPGAPHIALTFDDGPDPRDTPRLLDILAKRGVTATFFQLGERAERRPELVRAVADAGHQIGMHGYRHRPFPLEAPQVLRRHLAYTQRLLADISGCAATAICDVRPPYGFSTPTVFDSLTLWGYRSVMWSVVPFHWLQPAEPTIAQALQLVRPGSILVLHESLGGPPVAALADAIIIRLQEADYRFVTIDAMWRAQAVAAGQAG